RSIGCHSIDVTFGNDAEISYNYVANTLSGNDEFAFVVKGGEKTANIHDNYVGGVTKFGIFMGQFSGAQYFNPATGRTFEASNVNSWNNIVHDISSQGYSFTGGIYSNLY